MQRNTWKNDKLWNPIFSPRILKDLKFVASAKGDDFFFSDSRWQPLPMVKGQQKFSCDCKPKMTASEGNFMTIPRKKKSFPILREN